MKMTNEEKAKIIRDCDHCNACLKYSKGSYCFDYVCESYNDLMNAMNWKDEQYAEEKRELLGLVKLLKVNEDNQSIIEDLMGLLQ